MPIRLTDKEYIETIRQILDDPRSIQWYDEEDDGEILLRTGVRQNDDDEWELTEGARGF